MGVMLLSQDGKLSIDDPIIKYLPQVSSAAKDVTIRQLLSHTSGIRDYEFRPEIEGEECLDNTLTDLEKWFRTLDLNSPPGEKWMYQNTGYALLGRLIEKISGKSYGDFLNEKIFKPLGMGDTRLLDFDSLIDRRAKGYAFDKGEFVNGVHINPEVEFASGGLVSTTTDLAKLDAALFAEKLLRATTLKEMWSKATLRDGSLIRSYGLGFGLGSYKGRSRVGHTGGCPGFATAYQRFTDDKVSVILLTNGEQESGLIGTVSNEIAYFYLRK
jgi:CubicO group peptidase (beta-lactamase class C family)